LGHPSQTFFGSKIVNTLAPAIEIDPWFDYKTKYINALEQQTAQLANSSNQLAFKVSEIGELHREVSTAANLLAGTEGQVNKDVAGSLQRLAQLQFELYELKKELSANVKNSFDDDLRDYIRMLGSVKSMLAQRSERLANFQDATVNYRSKKERHDRVKAVGTNPNQLASLEAELARFEKSMHDEKEAFESISRSCRSEIERFEKLKANELQLSVVYLVTSNINNELRTIDVWKQFMKNTPDHLKFK